MGKMGKTIGEEEVPMFSHFSHEHPLELTNTSGTICSACNGNITAGKDYYTCKTCAYSLHRACFNMPKTLHLHADPNHELNLLFTQSFACKACGHQGSGFAYNCSICLVHYHTLCSRMLPTKKHNLHPHTLALQFSSPYGQNIGFRCDVCREPGLDHWLYRCDACEFDVHLNCITAMPKVQSQSHPSSQVAPIMNQNSGTISQNPVIQPQGNHVNQTQPQIASIAAGGFSTMPANYINAGSSIGAQSYTGSTAYVNHSPFMQGAPPVNQGSGYTNQPGGFNSTQTQTVLGGGVTGLVLTGAVTGMAEGMGQQIVQGGLSAFANDGSGSGSSDHNGWN